MCGHARMPKHKAALKLYAYLHLEKTTICDRVIDHELIFTHMLTTAHKVSDLRPPVVSKDQVEILHVSTKGRVSDKN